MRRGVHSAEGTYDFSSRSGSSSGFGTLKGRRGRILVVAVIVVAAVVVGGWLWLPSGGEGGNGNDEVSATVGKSESPPETLAYQVSAETCGDIDWQPVADAFSLHDDSWRKTVEKPALSRIHDNGVGELKCEAYLPISEQPAESTLLDVGVSVYPSKAAAVDWYEHIIETTYQSRDVTDFYNEYLLQGPKECEDAYALVLKDDKEKQDYSALSLLCHDGNIVLDTAVKGFPVADHDADISAVAEVLTSLMENQLAAMQR
jgi:hypothetical protein